MTNEEIDRKIEEFKKQLWADMKKMEDDALLADAEPSEQTSGWLKRSMDGFENKEKTCKGKHFFAGHCLEDMTKEQLISAIIELDEIYRRRTGRLVLEGRNET
jgi:hypothetical protein